MERSFCFRTFTTALAAIALAVGCSRSKDAVSPISMPLGALDAAPPDIKAQWQTAVKSYDAKDYLSSEQALTQVLSNQDKLTQAQNNAAQNAWMLLGNQAFDAANKGDDKATKAVLEMRDSPFGKAER